MLLPHGARAARRPLGRSALALLAASAAPLAAQVAGGRPVIRAQVATTYFSDIGPNRIGQGGSRSDVLIAPSLSAQIGRTLGRHRVSLDASIGRDFYLRNPRLGAFRLSGGGNAQLSVGPCRLGVTPRWSRGQTDLTQFVVGNLPDFDPRNIETVVQLGTQLGCGQLIGFQPFVSADWARGRNSNPLRSFGEYDSRALGAGLRYASPTLGEWSLGYQRGTTDYADRANLPGAATGYRQSSLQLSGSRSVTRSVSLNGAVGWTRVTPDAAAEPGFTGVTWSLGTTLVPLNRLQLTASTSRSVAPGLRGNALYAIDRSHALGATYALSSRLQLQGNWSTGASSFRGVGSALIDALRETRSTQMSLGASFTPSPRLRFGANVGRQVREANDPRYDYSSHFAGFTAGLTL